MESNNSSNRTSGSDWRSNFRKSRPGNDNNGVRNAPRQQTPRQDLGGGRVRPSQPAARNPSSRTPSPTRQTTPQASARARYEIKRVESSEKAKPPEDQPTALDKVSDLFTFDIPMSGEKFEIKKFLTSHKKELMILGGGLAGVVLLVGSFALIFRHQSDTALGIDGNSKSGPSFNPLVPLDTVAKSESGDEGSGNRIYDKKKDVLGLVTEYKGANLTISQQDLPKGINASDSSKLSEIAGKLGSSNEALETQKGTAYIASESGGSQTAVFATDEALIFIRSDKELLSDDWEFYINQLSPDS